MSITLLLLYGAMGGLTSVLLGALLKPFFPISGSVSSGALTARELGEAALHLFAGAAIAGIYWLSWGFAAVVAVPWWVRGLAFGTACWIAIALPSLATIALRTRMHIGNLAVAACEWACTCMFAALACAWLWATMP